MDMLDRLKSFFGVADPDERLGAAAGEDALAAAAAGLLVEAARLDADFAESERQAIRTVLVRDLHVDPGDADQLIAAAAADDGSLYGVTRTIREHLPPEDRYRILEMLWEVAYADGVLDHYEANLARRVAGLLYVTDQDSGAARQRVIERLGLSDDEETQPE